MAVEEEKDDESFFDKLEELASRPSDETRNNTLLPTQPPASSIYRNSPPKKLLRYLETCVQGSIILVDCEFDSFHNARSFKSLLQQIGYAYHVCQKSNLLLYVCGVGRKLRDLISEKIQNFDKWRCYITQRTLEDLVNGDNSLDAFDPLKNIAPRGNGAEGVDAEDVELIYLTADSPVAIDKFELVNSLLKSPRGCGPAAAGSPSGLGATQGGPVEKRRVGLVVGGLIDRNSCKEMCLTKARYLGIPHACLPITETLAKIGCRVLCTSHVVAILASRLTEAHTWEEATRAAVPSRKIEQRRKNMETYASANANANASPPPPPPPPLSPEDRVAIFVPSPQRSAPET